MSKTKDIREKFEAAILDVLAGRIVTDKDGEVVFGEDGRPLIVRPPAADLSVVRAYLKDQEGDGKGDVPQTGAPQGKLAEFAKRKGLSLPFAPGPETAQ